jgi:hypothetical protein
MCVFADDSGSFERCVGRTRCEQAPSSLVVFKP